MKNNFVLKRMYIFDELSSTMDISKEFIDRSVSEGIVIISKSQTKGRGSNKRKWISMGDDALFSIIIQPPVEKINLIPIVTAYSIFVTLKNIVDEKITIKWPNDVLVEGEKISGVLIENYIHNKLSNTVIGIGININSNHKGQNRFIYPSVSLKDITNQNLDVFSIILKFLDNFKIFYEKLINDDLDLNIISKNLHALGEKVNFRTHYKQLEKNKSENIFYKIISLNEDGTLKVADDDGNITNLSNSEIAFR